MSNAKPDENGRPTIICASKSDGQTIVPIQAQFTDHGLKIIDGTGQADNGNNLGNAMLDENSVPVWTALASDNSGNIVEVYGDPVTGSVLVDMI